MTKTRWYHVFEMAIACLLALLVAQWFNLTNGVSAGIIAILSIQNTKKKARVLAIERIAFFLTALLLAYVSFSLLGFTIFAYSLFVLVFSILCYRLEGIGSLSICCVLISHFLIAKEMTFPFILNEFFLLIIGVGFGLILNLLTPSSASVIQKKQSLLEEKMKAFLLALSDLMEGKTTWQQVEVQMVELENLVSLGHEQTLDYQDNTLFSPSPAYYIQYMVMRSSQILILSHVAQTAKTLDPSLPQTPILSAFFVKISATFHENNNAQALLFELNKIETHYQKTPLPVHRHEFEQRANLYRIMMEIKDFLLLKLNFINNLSAADRLTFEKSVLSKKHLSKKES
ncbi:MAG: hypothetical protein GX786_01165 [Clostridiales bacterium]|nr:hypothetical protein [Clostridiales bacterium]